MPVTPTLSDVIRQAIESRLEDVHVATIGRIEKYDATTQTADVLPVIQRPYRDADGEIDHETICVLPDVPVLFPRAGGYVLTMPLAKGDHVLLVFSHDCTGPWRETGAVSVPGDLRRHSLASAIAIPGIFPMTSLLSAGPTAVAARQAGIVIGKDGGEEVIEISASGIGLGHLAAQPVALAPPIVAAMSALAAAMTQLAAEVPIITALAPVAAACTAAAAACTAAVPTTPSTLVRAAR